MHDLWILRTEPMIRDIIGQILSLQLSIVGGLVVRNGDLSHEITLSHEGRRPECDNRV